MLSTYLVVSALVYFIGLVLAVLFTIHSDYDPEDVKFLLFVSLILFFVFPLSVITGIASYISLFRCWFIFSDFYDKKFKEWEDSSRE